MIGTLSNDSHSRTDTLAVLLATLVTLGVAFSAVGGIAAAASDEDQLADKTVQIDSDTQEVYLNVTNTSGDLVNYTVYGVSDGITTQVTSGQISATAGNSTEQTFAADTSSYDSYRFVVTENANDSDNETVQSIEVGEIVSQSADSGGAVFASAGGIFTPLNLLIGVLAVAAAFLLGLFDPIKKRLSG